MKTTIQHFHDWESYTFGYGYGSGEEHIVPALVRFLQLCTRGGNGRAYDFRELERELTAVVAWLLINRLAQVDLLEYGTSSRYAWLTEKGLALQAFVSRHTSTQLIDYTIIERADYVPCYPDCCNCEDSSCLDSNPFWSRKPT